MILAPKRQANLLFPLLAGLMLIGFMLAGMDFLQSPDGRHNVWYAYTDGDTGGMHPCNDNGNNFWLTMFIEWSNGKIMLPGSQHCVGVISAERVDELVEQELAKRELKEATWDQHQEVLNYVLKEVARGIMR